MLERGAAGRTGAPDVVAAGRTGVPDVVAAGRTGVPERGAAHRRTAVLGAVSGAENGFHAVADVGRNIARAALDGQL